MSSALWPRGVFFPGATPERATEIQIAALRQEGSLAFSLAPGPLYEQEGDVIVMQIPTGGTLLRVTRDQSRALHFLHSSPGTGTRNASVPLPDPVEGRSFTVYLTWSPSATVIYAGFAGTQPVHGEGASSRPGMRVVDGEIFEIGDSGVEVMGYQLFERGALRLRETAIEAWESTRAAVDVHMRGQPADGYLGQVVQSNLAIVMIATGLESYCSRRFRELPDEGRQPDLAALAREFLSRKDRAESAPLASLGEAMGIIRPDFGNYDDCKRVFRSGYGLRFGIDLGVSPKILGAVRRMIGYRHRIVHVSPLIGLINQPQVPSESPVFPDSGLANDVLGATDGFVRALHAATLRSAGKQGSN